MYFLFSNRLRKELRLVDYLLSMPKAPDPMPNAENKKSDIDYQMS